MTAVADVYLLVLLTMLQCGLVMCARDLLAACNLELRAKLLETRVVPKSLLLRRFGYVAADEPLQEQTQDKH